MIRFRVSTLGQWWAGNIGVYVCLHLPVCVVWQGVCILPQARSVIVSGWVYVSTLKCFCTQQSVDPYLNALKIVFTTQALACFSYNHLEKNASF